MLLCILSACKTISSSILLNSNFIFISIHDSFVSVERPTTNDFAEKEQTKYFKKLLILIRYDFRSKMHSIKLLNTKIKKCCNETK